MSRLLRVGASWRTGSPWLYWRALCLPLSRVSCMALFTSESGVGRIGPGALFIEPNLNLSGGPRNRGHKDLFGARAQQYPRTLAGGGSGGHHVIDHQQIPALNTLRPGHRKCATDIGPALVASESCLGGGFAYSRQRRCV